MNRIYTFVWRKSRKTLITVTENNKGQGKGGSSSATIGVILARTIFSFIALASLEANATCLAILSVADGYSAHDFLN
jgi:Extended Signal Peptide of Type V secretion system